MGSKRAPSSLPSLVYNMAMDEHRSLALGRHGGRSVEPPSLPLASDSENWNCNGQHFNLNFGKAARKEKLSLSLSPRAAAVLTICAPVGWTDRPSGACLPARERLGSVIQEIGKEKRTFEQQVAPYFLMAMQRGRSQVEKAIYFGTHCTGWPVTGRLFH